DDGPYEGRLCNLRREKAPICWPVALAVRNGAAEASWVGGSKKTSMLTGTIAHGGQVEITLHAWTRLGAPTEAILAGRAADGAIVASGRWLEGGAVRGEWKRAR
ncbi:MAG TPA: hypothetical protein VFO24_02420, partial [Usitatibacter sp.]|nr:hypothetical protein [Usitatibacter sp.]